VILVEDGQKGVIYWEIVECIAAKPWSNMS
jgi:hypothetical protein